MARESIGERHFDNAIKVINKSLEDGMVKEYRFHPVRKWRFDRAWPEKMCAVEIDGGQRAPMGGRHNLDPDRDKINTAISMGWRVLRFSTSQIKNSPIECIELLERVLNLDNSGVALSD